MRPLGFWIKEIDRRIEADLGRHLADENLTRRHWQILTTLARQGATTLRDLDAALAPFAPTVHSEVDNLIDRGWAAMAAPARLSAPAGPRAGTVALTPAGHAAHERVAERVHTFRAQLTAGLSEQDYVTLIALLERVAGNLTPA